MYMFIHIPTTLYFKINYNVYFLSKCFFYNMQKIPTSIFKINALGNVLHKILRKTRFL